MGSSFSEQEKRFLGRSLSHERGGTIEASPHPQCSNSGITTTLPANSAEERAEKIRRCLKRLCEDNPEGVTAIYIQDEVKEYSFVDVKSVLDGSPWAKHKGVRYTYFEKKRSIPKEKQNPSNSMHSTNQSDPEEAFSRADLEKSVHDTLKKLCRGSPRGVTAMYIQSEIENSNYFQVKSILDSAPWAVLNGSMYLFSKNAASESTVTNVPADAESGSQELTATQHISLHKYSEGNSMLSSKLTIKPEWLLPKPPKSYRSQFPQSKYSDDLWEMSATPVRDEEFFEYVTSLLLAAGQIEKAAPIYLNHSASEVLYIDSNKDVIVNRFERQLLSEISNVSLVADFRWESIVDDLNENVWIFSITVDFPDRNRSQNIADIHHLLHQYWNCTHSIVFFKNRDHYAISFANKERSHILSDWFSFYLDDEYVSGLMNIGNMTVDTSSDYFTDFEYSVARKYYIYPISVEDASYGMIPLHFLTPSLTNDEMILKEDIRTLIRSNMATYESIYGQDYVETWYQGQEGDGRNDNISDEIERISFELELAAEDEDEHQESKFEEDDSDNDEEFEDLDEFDEDIDPAIFDDPVLMVKWLEQQNK